MSRKVLILKRTEAGVSYGRVVKATEHMAMQDYAHAHVEQIVRDLLMKNAPQPLVSGFGYTLPGGMNFSVAEGQAVDALGRSFETMPAGQAQAVVIPAAHASLPRIDLVYATLTADQDVELGPLPHRRLLTSAEVAAGADPYPIENFDVYAERQSRATVAVRQGVAAANPAAPAAGAGETPLYHVRVEANAIAITADKVTDVRNLMRSLRDAWVQIDSLTAGGLSETIDDRVAQFIADATYLTGVYNDPANTYSLDLDVAATQELIRDTIASFLNVTGSATGSHNDPGDQYTINVPSPDLSSRVAKAGDTMTGILYINVPGQSTVYSLDIQNVHTGGGETPAPARCQVNASNSNRGSTWEFGTGDPSIIEWEAFFIKRTTGGGLITKLAASPAGTSKLYGNWDVTGALSKASGTFLIDHPLDPANKDLVHGFVESNRYGLLYCLTTQLVAGAKTVNLDTALGLTQGTFHRIAQQAEIVSVRSKTHPSIAGAVGAADIVYTDTGGGIFTSTFVLSSTDPEDASEVVVMIYAARKDPFILTAPWVDGQGRMVAEQLKAVPTAAELDLLDPITVSVEADDERAGTTIEEVVAALMGKQGYPRHPGIGGAPNTRPTRDVSYEEITPAP